MEFCVQSNFHPILSVASSVFFFFCQSEKSLSSDLIKEYRQQFHHLACLLTAARPEPPGQENRNHFRFCLTPYQQHWTHLLFLSVFSSLFPNFHSRPFTLISRILQPVQQSLCFPSCYYQNYCDFLCQLAKT